MRKGYILLFIFCFISFSSQAQLKGLLKKAKDKANKLLDKDDAKDAGGNLLNKQQAEADTTTFTYAFSLADNSSFVGKSGSANKSLAISAIEGITKPEDSNKSNSERAMDYNRTGETLYSIGKYKAAGFKLFSALMLYADNSGEANMEEKTL
jgi:hypothetical protein